MYGLNKAKRGTVYTVIQYCMSYQQQHQTQNASINNNRPFCHSTYGPPISHSQDSMTVCAGLCYHSTRPPNRTCFSLYHRCQCYCARTKVGSSLYETSLAMHAQILTAIQRAQRRSCQTFLCKSRARQFSVRLQQSFQLRPWPSGVQCSPRMCHCYLGQDGGPVGLTPDEEAELDQSEVSMRQKPARARAMNKVRAHPYVCPRGADRREPQEAAGALHPCLQPSRQRASKPVSKER